MKKISSDQTGIAHVLLIVIVVFILVAGLGLWRVYDNQQNSKSAQINNAENVLDKLGTNTKDAKGQDLIATGNTDEKKSDTPTASKPTSTTTKPTQASPTTTKPSTSTPAPDKGTGSTSPSYPGDNGDTPQVTLTNPSSWKQVVSGSFTATATASDSSGVKKVVFMIRKIGQAAAVQTVLDYSAPYSAVLDVSSLPNGDSDYTVEAQVYDNAGSSNLASYRINIQN